MLIKQSHLLNEKLQTSVKNLRVNFQSNVGLLLIEPTLFTAKDTDNRMHENWLKSFPKVTLLYTEIKEIQIYS